MSKHTPGPWMVKVGGYAQLKVKVICERGYCVAESFSSPSAKIKYKDLWDEAEANANLIAAAPDLLGVLEEIEHYWICEEPQNARQYLSKKVTDLITKAKGESK